MSVLERIAYFQGRRDEVPNQELARALAAQGDTEGIRVIAENLWNENKNVQADCLKVLYEIGDLEPALVADYMDDFLKLLKSSSNNRLVWGSMIALTAIATLKADELYANLDEIKRAFEKGSVITRDNGVKVLAIIAAAGVEYREALTPYMLKHLETCRPKDVPQHAESMLPAIDDSNKDAFLQILDERMAVMSNSQSARLKKLKRRLR